VVPIPPPRAVRHPSRITQRRAQMESSMFAVVGFFAIPVFALVLGWAIWDEARHKKAVR